MKLADLDQPAVAHDHVGHERGREEPVLDDACGRGQPRSELLGVVELAGVVRDHAAVRAPRGVAERDRPEPSQGPGETVLEQLERHRRRQALDELVRGDDHDEAVGRSGDRLLARVRGTASLHEPARGRDLVGAVDRDVEAGERFRAAERLDVEAELASRLLGGRRRRDAAQVEPACGEGGQERADTRARAQPDGHAVSDELGSSLGGEPLFVLGAHEGGRYPLSMLEPSPERELKLAVGPEFRMPSIYGLVPGMAVRRSEPERLSTTYFDTEDLRLARWGASFRHRPGEGWTVKLPAEGDGAILARPELTFAGDAAQAPGEAVDLVRAFTRSSELRIQTRLSTLRRRIVLQDADGRLVVGVVEDEVSVQDGGSSTGFRELEVEIDDATPPALIDALVDRLRQAGAEATDPISKYIRSLGSRASLSPEIPVTELTSGASAGDVVRRAIALSVIRLIRHDPVMRLDADPEGVHQARVATRRLRSDLQTFGSLVDPTWTSSLREELRWLASLLGAVRDGDVLLERLRGRSGELPESDQPSAALVLATLEAARDQTHAELLAALRGDRYVELLDRLVAAANAPALLPAADAPSREVLPGLARRPWRSLERCVRALGSSPTDEELHDIRIRTKRARYAAEAVAPVAGKQARAFAGATARLQEVLGNLNDAVVAERWLLDWAHGSRSTEGVLAAGELAAVERAAAQRSRERWKKAWKELSSPKLRSWM